MVPPELAHEAVVAVSVLQGSTQSSSTELVSIQLEQEYSGIGSDRESQSYVAVGIERRAG